MKTAIVYYSMSGNVRWVAQQIAGIIDADLIELKCVREYPDKGFKKFYWGGKSAVMREKPKLQPYSFRSDEYGRVVLGTPVWASNIAPPLRTFLSQNKDKLSEKKISAFACMSGAGGQKALERLSDIVSLDQKMILIDPLDKKNSENDRKIRELCNNL